MLPFGRTWVPSAATVRLIASERSIEPEPTFDVSEPIFTRLDGSPPVEAASGVSRPKKFVRLALSELVRDRVVVLFSLALSATVMFTVMMSPGRLARGSWKKLREPEPHSELAARVGIGGGGSGTIGATIFTGEAGSAIVASAGGTPISSMRVTAEQPASVAPAAARSRIFEKERSMDVIPSGRKRYGWRARPRVSCPWRALRRGR